MTDTTVTAPASVRIDFLYSEDCPSHERALALLNEVIAEEGVIADITIQEIETEEDAERFLFPGSPTIRVRGADIVETGDMPCGLSCRAYMNNGRISPLPPRDAIVTALRRAKEGA